MKRLALALLLLCSAPVLAAEITITGTDGGDISDAYIFSTGDHTNNGASTVWLSHNTQGGADLNGLVKIATSAIPEMDTCTTFRLDGNWAVNFTVVQAVTTAHRLTRDWGEGAKVNAGATAGESDWQDAAHGTTTWSTPGARHEENDRATNTVAPTITVPSGDYTAGDAFTWSLTGDALAWPVGWFDTSLPNYGMVIESAEPASGNSGFQIRSSENVTSQLSFYLVYSVTAAGTTPPDPTHSQRSHFYDQNKIDNPRRLH